MIKETLSFLLENSCSESSTLVLETLHLQNSSIALLLTSHKHRAQAYKQINKQEQLRTNTPNKEKLNKSVQKDRACCYGHESIRNAENGGTFENKQLSEDLCYKREQRNYMLHLF
jgi:hypothetical protein